MTVQNFTDLWFFSIRRAYSSQFGKVKELPEEFMLKMEEEIELSRSQVSSRVSPTMDLDKEGEGLNDEEEESGSIFNDPLKQMRQRRSRTMPPESNKIESRESPEEIQERLKNEHEPKTLGKIEEGSEAQEAGYSKTTLAEAETARGAGKKKINVIVERRVIHEELKGEETPVSPGKGEAELSEGESAGRKLLNLQRVETPSDAKSEESQEMEQNQDDQYNFKPKREVKKEPRRSRKSPEIKIDLAQRPSIEEGFEGSRMKGESSAGLSPAPHIQFMDSSFNVDAESNMGKVMILYWLCNG